jgi:hypothetical protein
MWLTSRQLACPPRVGPASRGLSAVLARAAPYGLALALTSPNSRFVVAVSIAASKAWIAVTSLPGCLFVGVLSGLEVRWYLFV